MGFFEAVYNIANYIHNKIVGLVYPHNIIPDDEQFELNPGVTTPATPNVETPPRETIITSEATPEEPMELYTITDDNENEIYTSLMQSSSASVKLCYRKSAIENAHGNTVRPDPLIDLNSGLSIVLLTNVNLRHVDLSAAGIDTAGLLTLADILARNDNRLESLNLANNNREGTKSSRDAGLRALFTALGGNRTLKSLNLHRTNITNNMAEWIAEFLATNRSLVSIDLSYNELYARGIRFLVRAIQRNPNSAVTYISLVNNNVYEYDIGVEPNPTEVADTSILDQSSLGDQNTLYRFIREISATTDDTNINRAALSEFLAFAFCAAKMHKNTIREIPDDVVSRVGTMLFSHGAVLRRANVRDSETDIIKHAPEPLALSCPANRNWEGPRIS